MFETAFTMPLHDLVRFIDTRRTFRRLVRPPIRPILRVRDILPLPLRTPFGLYPINYRLCGHLAGLGFSPPVESSHVTPAVVMRSGVSQYSVTLAYASFNTGLDQ